MMKVATTSADENEREAVIRFVRRFCSLPTRAADQRTSEFFALIDEALRTGEIDAKLRVINSPELSGV